MTEPAPLKNLPAPGLHVSGKQTKCPSARKNLPGAWGAVNKNCLTFRLEVPAADASERPFLNAEAVATSDDAGGEPSEALAGKLYRL